MKTPQNDNVKLDKLFPNRHEVLIQPQIGLRHWELNQNRKLASTANGLFGINGTFYPFEINGGLVRFDMGSELCS